MQIPGDNDTSIRDSKSGLSVEGLKSNSWFHVKKHKDRAFDILLWQLHLNVGQFILKRFFPALCPRFSIVTVGLTTRFLTWLHQLLVFAEDKHHSSLFSLDDLGSSGLTFSRLSCYADAPVPDLLAIQVLIIPLIFCTPFVLISLLMDKIARDLEESLEQVFIFAEDNKLYASLFAHAGRNWSRWRQMRFLCPGCVVR